MPDTHIDATRRAYRAFNRGGVESILEFLDPRIEWRMGEQFSREPRVYHGHDGAREVIGVFEENYDDFEALPQEFIEAGDSVIVPVCLRGKAKGTGEESRFELVHVWTVRRELAARLDVYPSKEDAFEAAGNGPSG